MEQLRVLSVIPGTSSGSTMIFARTQVASLAKAGIITRSFFLLSRTSPLQLWGEVRRFRQEVAEFRPDVIHAHYGTMNAFFCSLLASCPLVVTYQGSDLNPCPSMNRARWLLGKILSEAAALRAARIICVSQQLKSRLWWNRSRATVLPSGVDTGVFHPSSRDEARSKLGWEPAEKVVIFSAGAHPQVKRLDLAQAAVQAAEAMCGTIRFVVLDGRMEQPRMPTLFNGADCFLMTSDWEGSPNIVKEAIACNLPIVSVDVGDVKERVTPVRPSKITARDPIEIGRALAEILQKQERSNGYEVIQEISAEKVAERVARIYHEARRHG